ncbi:MAG: acyl carrier protein [Crocosphaera sp.]|nr:acyl carrier protein [Crocosphaera sp.]
MSTSHRQIQTKDIQNWLIKYVSEKLNQSSQPISIKKPLALYGLDSMAQTTMIDSLGQWLDLEIEPTIIYDYPTIQGLSEYLEKEAKFNFI